MNKPRYEEMRIGDLLHDEQVLNCAKTIEITLFQLLGIDSARASCIAYLVLRGSLIHLLADTEQLDKAKGADTRKTCRQLLEMLAADIAKVDVQREFEQALARVRPPSHQ